MDFNRFSGGMFLHETVGRDITINNQVRISNILSGSDQDGINERWGVFEGCPGYLVGLSRAGNNGFLREEGHPINIDSIEVLAFRTWGDTWSEFD
ncbi:uncharacterized protein ATNIH1004_000029 [Aspergillus tanneri]|uniref:Uncharacterized protein n=1 Tax=Aspergillus tanneri TaxID=1220188 RepID=A0A5M9MVJ5_9EURO|nr:uncharacterized protein ATNIH1004_000029 [Aspergillus tanneri]KAA8651151.1 hypothetical protein ATNIH1004_000029 [Aspergillus tanneri]